MMTIILMIVTMVGIMASPIIIPGIIYDATENEGLANDIQMLLVLLSIAGLVAWLMFFC